MRFPQVLTASRSPAVLIAGIFVAAAALSVLTAWLALVSVENLTRTGVEKSLFLEGAEWASVETNGLQVVLSGTAPDEPARFRALSAAGRVVDSGRVIDHMEVLPPQEITPPRFTIEMLRNEAGISMIGLIPATTDRAELSTRVQKIEGTGDVADFLESADYPQPENWQPALNYALMALELLPRSKISMDADRVAIEAISDSAAQKSDWEKRLKSRVPGGVKLVLDITAPRPVITPFTLRFLIDDAGARFDACTAHTPEGRDKIVAAGAAAGVTGAPVCTVALGVPSPDWPNAVVRSIQALHELGSGSLTFSDADITLIADPVVAQATYDRVIGELEADLPEVFSLHAVKTEPEVPGDASQGPPEFTATLSPEGHVQLRGRVATDEDRTVVESFARAHFGVDNLYSAMRLDPELPMDWSVRMLSALDALSQLASGVVVVKPDTVDVTGATGDANASAEISRVLSEKLGEAQDFHVNVEYREELDPVAALPSPEECVASIEAAMAEQKINFAPGSSNIELASAKTIDQIAEILKTCPDVAMEIGGYTDSQGREEMNKALSQRRAEAVLTALLARRVLTSNLSAHGYGEENPIADNGTDAGREANRRIEFHLIGQSASDEGPAAAGAADATDAATAEPAADTPAAEAPPTRPEDARAAEETPAEAEAPEAEAPEAATPEAAAAAASPEAEGTDTAAAAAPDSTDTTDAATDTSPVAVDPDLAGKRPKPRPAN